MTNHSEAELQDQFSGESLSTFLKLLLQVCAKSVNDHEAIPAGTDLYYNNRLGSFSSTHFVIFMEV